MVRRLVVSFAFLLALPASSQAADVSLASGQLRYTAAAGKVNNVTLIEAPTGTVTIERITKDEDPFATVEGCVPTTPTVNTTVVTCTGVTSAVIDAGDQSDRITAGYLDDAKDFHGLTSVTTTITGGDGNDALAGGARRDIIDGFAGNDDIDGFAGNDQLSGGDGNDELRPNTGTDTMVGGDGVDTAAYGQRVSPGFSLDGLANDGGAGENDLIGTDIENVEAATEELDQIATVVGDGRANRLTVTYGKGNITGGEGSDVLEGASQDDTINSRDGSPDTVICNGGTDTVLSDTLDTISPSCENVQTLASPGGPFDDHAPTIVWTTPTAGSSITANTPSTLAVNATDDRGLTRVQFFDDDRLVCEDTVAPYSCAYQPRGGDVGRNTLIAVATDGANQTSSVVRVINVRRFAPKELGLSFHPSRDRKAPYAFRLTGRVLRPDPVSPSQGCTGTITLTAKRGSKVISTKRATLTRTCEYSATFKFRTRAASRLRFQAKFGGNEVLSTVSSKTRTARLG
jgi:hypothetical protein